MATSLELLHALINAPPRRLQRLDQFIAPVVTRISGDYPEVSLDLRTDNMIDPVREGGSTWRSCRHDRLT
jgi:hypothetical protein